MKNLKRLRWLIIVLFGLGCKSVHRGAASEVKFKLLPNKSYLMSHLYDSSTRICVENERLSSKEYAESLTKDAWNTWNAVLKEFDPSISTQIDFSCAPLPSGEKPLRVIFSRGFGRSFFVEAPIPQVTLYAGLNEGKPDSTFGTQLILTHEFGHAFGLADTYLESDVGKKLRRGTQQHQPFSIMSSTALLNPQEDDRLGIGAIYARQYGSRVRFDSEGMSDNQIATRLMGRITGDYEDPCFFEQYRRVWKEIKSKEFLKKRLRPFVHRPGKGPQKTLIWIARQASTANASSAASGIYDDGDWVHITFGSNGGTASTDDRQRETENVETDRFGQRSTCQLVSTESIQQIFSQMDEAPLSP